MNKNEATQLIANDLEYLGGGRGVTVVELSGRQVILVTMPDESVLEISVRPAP